MQEALLVFITVPNEEVANLFANELVTSKLAACINIIPNVTSIYSYQGKIHKDNELQLIIKTSKSCYERLEEWISNNHPYEVPEIIFANIAGGSAKYINWLTKECKQNDTDKA